VLAEDCQHYVFVEVITSDVYVACFIDRISASMRKLFLVSDSAITHKLSVRFVVGVLV
jgi:hypothetical protein